LTPADSTKRIAALLGKLRAASTAETHVHTNAEPGTVAANAPDAPGGRWNDPVLTELIRSILVEDATLAVAEAQLSRLGAAMVDANELRVCLPAEVVAILQTRSAETLARAVSIRSSLGEIFRREHAVSLHRLIGHGKREAVEYIGSLPGVSPFAAARTLLLALDVHAMPVDACLAGRLSAAGVVDKSASPTEIAAMLTKAVRAGEGPVAYQMLREWSQTAAAAKRPAVKTRAKTPRRAASRRKTKTS